VFAASWVCLDGRSVFGSAARDGRAHNDSTVTTFLGLAQQQWASAAIAPASGCRKFFDALGSTDKTWLLCAETVGFSKGFQPRGAGDRARGAGGAVSQGWGMVGTAQ